MTVSNENAAHSKSTKSRNSDSLVSRGTDSNWDFDLIWICTQEFEFLELAKFWGVAFSVGHAVFLLWEVKHSGGNTIWVHSSYYVRTLHSIVYIFHSMRAFFILCVHFPVCVYILHSICIFFILFEYSSFYSVHSSFCVWAIQFGGILHSMCAFFIL